MVTVWARQASVWEVARAGAVASLVFALLMVVFVVPPLARSAEFPVQLTSGGLIFFGIFAVVAFSAWNTGNNLLFLVFSVLASTIFVAWSAARASLRDLIVSARFPDHIFAGEPAAVVVTLHNRKRVLPSFSVLVEARWSDGDVAPGARRGRGRNLPLAYFMYAPRGARVEQRVGQTFKRRGRLHVIGFEISTRFPFGFFRLRKRLRTRDLDLIVYPRPEPAGDDLHLLPMNAGRVASARRGAGHELHSLRDYQSQDDMRHIDWKATARAGRLTVREFTAEDERRVHVIFDTRLHPAEDETGGPDARGDGGNGEGAKASRADAPAARFGSRRRAAEAGRREREARSAERFERGVTLVASLVKHFIDERAEVRLTLGGETGRYGEGPEQLYASLRRLALVSPRAAHADADPPDDFWQRITLDARDTYVILITTAPRGSIPAHVWRKSHVIHV